MDKDALLSIITAHSFFLSGFYFMFCVLLVHF